MDNAADNSINTIAFDDSGRGGPAPGMVYTAALVVLLLSFVLPFPEKILDGLWICSFVLSGAVSIICIVARNSCDLIGFVPMISGLIFLRLITQTGVAHHIIRDEPAGLLLGWTGSALTFGRPLGAILFCLLFVIIAAFSVFVSCGRIALASDLYLRRVLPLKRMGVETDLRLGVINENQAGQLARRIVSEWRFFSDMNRVGLLMRIEVVICVVILLACLITPAANRVIDQPAGKGLLSAIVPPVAALSLFTLIPSMVMAITCGMLMSKETLTTLPTGKQYDLHPQQNQAITVIAMDSNGPEKAGRVAPDSIRHGGPDEHVVEFKPKEQSSFSDSVFISRDISCRNATEYYEKLSRVVCTVESHPRVILLAADQVHSLPVTVPINIAIRLSQKGQKVLLVDTEPQRHAMASVFEMDPEALRKKVLPSSLESLSVCCVPAHKLGKFLQKDKILSRFETTLIYAPQVFAIEETNIPVAIKLGAFYFIDVQDSEAEKRAAAKMAYCGWLCMIPSIQSVLDSHR